MSEYAGFDWGQLVATAKAATFEALPNGDYQVECVSADATHSSTGKPMIKVKFKVTEGPHANRTILSQLTLSPDNETALSIFFRQMKAFGLGEDFFARVPAGQLGPVASAMVGRRVTVKLTQREWQGEMRNNVAAIMPPLNAAPAGGMPNQMPPTGVMGPMGGMPMGGMPMQPQMQQPMMPPQQAPQPQMPASPLPAEQLQVTQFTDQPQANIKPDLPI
jgi:hypothetical protein